MKCSVCQRLLAELDCSQYSSSYIHVKNWKGHIFTGKGHILTKSVKGGLGDFSFMLMGIPPAYPPPLLKNECSLKTSDLSIWEFIWKWEIMTAIKSKVPYLYLKAWILEEAKRGKYICTWLQFVSLLAHPGERIYLYLFTARKCCACWP